ncbi:hypothetical protein ACSVH2_12680 [Flavobacterium sp. RSB2_4_14]|uniref:hypothetical protein n=1 Tax=Flavobacterium sp. RSB2_4_14 TaxID=3447665 RepID=UPI003F3FE4BB
MMSKFKIVSYFIPLFFLFVIGLFVSTLMNMEATFTSSKAGSFVILLLFLTILIVFIEMRDKIISIQITESELRIKRYIGIGNTVLKKNTILMDFIVLKF